MNRGWPLIDVLRNAARTAENNPRTYGSRTRRSYSDPDSFPAHLYPVEKSAAQIQASEEAEYHATVAEAHIADIEKQQAEVAKELMRKLNAVGEKNSVRFFCEPASFTYDGIYGPYRKGAFALDVRYGDQWRRISVYSGDLMRINVPSVPGDESLSPVEQMMVRTVAATAGVSRATAATNG